MASLCGRFFLFIPQAHWAKAIVEEAGSRMLVQGAGEGKFYPDAQITRAEYVTLLVRCAGSAEARRRGCRLRGRESGQLVC
ncbi:S-layer homology domain-containing protein [Paenibacillus sp. TAB 01]|uniref:S-layer homology domain-containing protein n=1 Tax=Paenibacillus sp. TAB 01 TaxID=3368988 RepID=UPI0037514BD9